MKIKLPKTAKRVAAHTKPQLNVRIRRKAVSEIEEYQTSRRAQLDQKIRSLDAEWDTERVLETNAAALILLGSLISCKYSKKWLWLSGGVSFFLLLHALQGWCPPLPLIRKLGVRTAEEISLEKHALKLLRGDFMELGNDARELYTAMEKS